MCVSVCVYVRVCVCVNECLEAGTLQVCV